MAEIQNDQTDIEPLDDDTLEEVAGGSSGGCCSCSSCSIKPAEPTPVEVDIIIGTGPSDIA